MFPGGSRGPEIGFDLPLPFAYFCFHWLLVAFAAAGPLRKLIKLVRAPLHEKCPELEVWAGYRTPHKSDGCRVPRSFHEVQLAEMLLQVWERLHDSLDGPVQRVPAPVGEGRSVAFLNRLCHSRQVVLLKTCTISTFHSLKNFVKAFTIFMNPAVHGKLVNILRCRLSTMWFHPGLRTAQGNSLSLGTSSPAGTKMLLCLQNCASTSGAPGKPRSVPKSLVTLTTRDRICRNCAYELQPCRCICQSRAYVLPAKESCNFPTLSTGRRDCTHSTMVPSPKLAKSQLDATISAPFHCGDESVNRSTCPRERPMAKNNLTVRGEQDSASAPPKRPKP